MVRKLLTCAAIAAAVLAEAAYPSASSGYSFVDVSHISVTGNPMPLRSGGSEYILKAEDAACLAEMACERDTWLNITNAPTEAGLSATPTFALTSNILAAVNAFVTERGNEMHDGASGASSSDPKRMFVDTGWECSMQENVPEDAGDGWSWWYYGLGSVVGHVQPQRVEQSASFSGMPTVSGVTSLYDDVNDRKRLFGGWVDIYGYQYRDYGFGEGWTALHIGYIKAGSSYVLHSYDGATDSNGQYTKLVSETKSGYQFLRNRWIRGQGSPSQSLPGGACSPFGWTTTSVTPYVVINPVFYGKVKSATLYAVMDCTIYEDFDYPDYVSHTTTKLAVVRVPLVKNGTEALYGKTCEKWKLPDTWKDSRQLIDKVLYDLYGATSASGFPTVSGASLLGGVLDLELTPRYGPSTGE